MRNEMKPEVRQFLDKLHDLTCAFHIYMDAAASDFKPSLVRYGLITRSKGAEHLTHFLEAYELLCWEYRLYIGCTFEPYLEDKLCINALDNEKLFQSHLDELRECGLLEVSTDHPANMQSKELEEFAQKGKGTSCRTYKDIQEHVMEE